MTAADRTDRTEAELARIAGLADAATKGPWTRSITADRAWNEIRSAKSDAENVGDERPIARSFDDDSSEFIADARTTVPWLIKQVRLRDAAIADVAGLDFAEIVAHVDDSGGWFNIFPEEARQIGDAIRTAITRALTPEGDPNA